jgi:chlorite dismutase
MNDPLTPADGLGVLHLFCRIPRSRFSLSVNRRKLRAAVVATTAAGDQVVTVAILGHKADLAFMVLGEDLWRLRDFQTSIANAGLEVVDSYVSMTELSEYSQGLPDEMRRARLHPVLPPEGKPAWCFYPMSKRRNVDANWFTLPYDDRRELMMEHGTSGRKFAGRILQVVTGSTGVDDFEWGVTLFGQRLDDLKDVVYTMRYDHASAVYGEFGVFYAGMVADLDTVMAGIRRR